MNKILLIDKPADWTSFDVVAKVRGVARVVTGNKKIKVGHAGTLDPFATGLLIVLAGNETKNQDSYMKQDKEYLATLKLGFTSNTGDPEGEITPYCHSEPSHCHPECNEGSRDSSGSQNDTIPTPDDVEKTLKQFLGEITQIPPIYSAIKVDGKRAYKLAREGKNPEMKPRQIAIHELQIINYQFPILEIQAKCSSGTYIRTLGEDIGKALGTGAYLTALRRTKIGNFDISDAETIDETLKNLAK